MIKIKLTVDQFNKINQFGKRYNDIKNKARPSLRYTRLTVKGNNLKAEGLDGYKLFEINFKIENISSVDGIIFIETMNNYKKSDLNIIIEEEKEEVRISDIKNNDIRIMKKDDITFFDTKGIIPEDDPVFEIYLNPNTLRDALDAYNKDDIIKLEFFDKVKPVKIDNLKDAKSIVLPMRYKI